jgi:hypothetical protein
LEGYLYPKVGVLYYISIIEVEDNVGLGFYLHLLEISWKNSFIWNTTRYMAFDLLFPIQLENEEVGGF